MGLIESITGSYLGEIELNMASAQFITCIERRGSTGTGESYVFRSFESAIRSRIRVLADLKDLGFEPVGWKAPTHDPCAYLGTERFPIEGDKPLFDTVDQLTDGRGLLVITSLSADCIEATGYKPFTQ